VRDGRDGGRRAEGAPAPALTAGGAHDRIAGRLEAAAMDYDSPLRRHLREALQADPSGAYRDWFRAQEELSEHGEADAVRALAEDLWEILPTLPFFEDVARARFFHNVGVFYGSPGPPPTCAARGARSERRSTTSAAMTRPAGARARLHNLATAVASLGTTPAELEEAVRLFEQALEWRTSEREIARGVTLHNLGLALLRRADLDPRRAGPHLDAAAEAFREAVSIRERNNLAEGRAASQRQLEIALRRARGGSALTSRPAGRRGARRDSSEKAR
jgi:tetratricopeptide (TPR) repeat protein